MRRAFISEAVNLRKDTAAAGGEDKQADNNFSILLRFLLFVFFVLCFVSYYNYLSLRCKGKCSLSTNIKGCSNEKCQQYKL